MTSAWNHLEQGGPTVVTPVILLVTQPSSLDPSNRLCMQVLCDLLLTWDSCAILQGAVPRPWGPLPDSERAERVSSLLTVEHHKVEKMDVPIYASAWEQFLSPGPGRRCGSVRLRWPLCQGRDPMT